MPTAAIRRYLSALTPPAGPDAELLARYAADRDPEAFTELVRRFGPLVFGVCRRTLGPGPDADDAFQATFLALARSAGRVRHGVALPAWLHRVAVRTAGKARSRRQTVVPLAEVADRDDPFAEVTWREVRRLLDAELDRLPERYRGPVVLCLLDGLTRDEAARRLGCSLNTVKRRLDAGRELLRDRLTRRGLGGVAVATAVLTPDGLRADVPDGLLAAATGPTPTVAVAALAASAGRRITSRAIWFAAAVVVGTGVGGGLFALAPADPPPAATQPAADKKPADPPGYFVWPVRTALQRELIQPHTVNHVLLVNGRPGIIEQGANLRKLPLTDLRNELERFGPPAERSVLVTVMFAGEAGQFDSGACQTLQLAVDGYLRFYGQAQVQSISSHVQNGRTWEQVTAGYSSGADPAVVTERPAADGPVTGYPVRTKLSRYLSSGADYVLVVEPRPTGPAVPDAVKASAKAVAAGLEPSLLGRVKFCLRHPENQGHKQPLIDAYGRLAKELGFQNVTVAMR